MRLFLYIRLLNLSFSLFVAVSSCTNAYANTSPVALSATRDIMVQNPYSLFVKEFILWYVNEPDSKKAIMNDKTIEQFVAYGTLERLKGDLIYGTLPKEMDYFLKVQDFDVQSVINSIKTYPTITLTDVILVPISFEAFDGRGSIDLVIYLKMIGDKWKIIKVEDSAI